MRLRPAAAALLAASLAAPAARAGEPEVEELTLPNGLTVLLHPLERAPDVAVVVLYAVGEDDDPDDACGFAHLLRHLGGSAPVRSKGRRSGPDVPGDAWTGPDFTVFRRVAKEGDLAAVLEEAATSMARLEVRAEDLEREAGRVIEDLALAHRDYPGMAAMNLARDAVSGRSARPGGGLAGHVRSITLDQARKRWDRYYKPRNATLAIAGRFSADAARAAVRDAFAGVARGVPVPPPRAPTGDPSSAASSPVRVVHRRSAKALGDAWASLALATGPMPAGLAHAVAYLRMRRASSALPVGGDALPAFPVTFAPLDRPGVLCVASVVREGETPDAAVARLAAFVDGAYLEPVTEGERRQALRLLVPDVDERTTSPADLAYALGRRRQLGWTREALEGALARLAPGDLVRARDAAPRAHVVVRPL